jgi:hypothetical protein
MKLDGRRHPTIQSSKVSASVLLIRTIARCLPQECMVVLCKLHKDLVQEMWISSTVVWFKGRGRVGEQYLAGPVRMILIQSRIVYTQARDRKTDRWFF